MPSVAEACAVLGVSEGDDPDRIRAAYRRRMRSLHPDHGGDDSDEARAAISEVVAAWRVLSGHEPPSAPGPSSGTDETDDWIDDDYDARSVARDWTEIDPEDRMSPRLLRVFFVAATVLVLGWLAIFFVIAWSQSG